MARVKNSTKKASQTRNRVRFHRALKKQLRNEQIQVQKYMENLNVSNESVRSVSQQTDDDLEESSIETKLKEWIVKYKIKRIAVSDLLKILRYSGMYFLPIDSKTFMQTPKSVEIMKSCDGKLWYHGIAESLLQLFPELDHDIELYLNFNIDGLPLAHSSTIQFWPILASIQSMFIIFKFCS